MCGLTSSWWKHGWWRFGVNGKVYNGRGLLATWALDEKKDDAKSERAIER